jgi:hypothetical protein
VSKFWVDLADVTLENEGLGRQLAFSAYLAAVRDFQGIVGLHRKKAGFSVLSSICYLYF